MILIISEKACQRWSSLHKLNDQILHAQPEDYKRYNRTQRTMVMLNVSLVTLLSTSVIMHAFSASSFWIKTVSGIILNLLLQSVFCVKCSFIGTIFNKEDSFCCQCFCDRLHNARCCLNFMRYILKLFALLLSLASLYFCYFMINNLKTCQSFVFQNASINYAVLSSTSTSRHRFERRSECRHQQHQR